MKTKEEGVQFEQKKPLDDKEEGSFGGEVKVEAYDELILWKT